MANPNIVGVTTITGKTAVLAVTTSALTFVSNPVSSAEIYKINTLIVSNIDGVSAADITLSLVRSGIAYKLASTISVPSDSTLILLSKDTSIYLEEGDSLQLLGSANGDLQAVCSYEVIS
jgi:hypothetical protein